jgi:hypothetical protein
MEHAIIRTLPLLALLALTGPAAAGCVGSACVDGAGNVFTVSPQGNILGLNAQTGQQFTGSQSSNGVTIITPAPQGLPSLPLIGVNK